jgi:hypothetical protein
MKSVLLHPSISNNINNNYDKKHNNNNYNNDNGNNNNLNNENCDWPRCSCMKCIIRRERSQRKGNYQFSSMGTIYMNDFEEKKTVVSPNFLNRSIRNNFEESYNKHLPNSLMSTMKFDFKQPFKVKPDNDIYVKNKINPFPFCGRSSYKATYGNYGSASNGNEPKENLPFIKVPFRGKSNYEDDYKEYKEDIYSNRDGNMKINCSLEFKGYMSPQSLNKEQYKPADFSKKYYFSEKRFSKNIQEKGSILAAKYHDADSSSYNNFFKKKIINCKLGNFLNNKGVGYMQL